MRRSERLRLAGLCALALAWSAAPVPAGETRTVDRLQTEARGFYLLWSEGKSDAEEIANLAFVRGGQVVVQWADVEPAPGRYDFSAIDRGLARLAAHDKWTTLQVNGNDKPTWLFAQVPHVAQKLSDQVRDREGTLMFWHPRFQEAHLAMLEALAAHLRASPHRGKLLGLRLNFNAVGTEHFRIAAEFNSPRRWTVPAGVDAATLVPFTPAVQASYVERVVSTYDRLFADWTTVFVRNNIDDELQAKLADRFARGRLALFHTSSEAEPRSAGLERQYGAFYDLCRSGQTIAYAEPWASAWGEHGSQVDPRWCSPAQWNYWTILLNLHCGVSFIGEYYSNLHYAISGRHPGSPSVAANSAGPSEFMAAYRWASGYVGRHNRPTESPGAWVAFRQNAVVKAANPRVLESGRHLARFTGDYTWLAERVGEDGSKGVGPVGPADQRYGAFAREYPAGASARIRIDSAFVRSLTGEARLRVIALCEGAAEVRVGARRWALPPSPQRWSVTEFAVSAAELQRTGDGPQIVIQAGAQPLTLHFVELCRPSSPSL